MIIFVQKVLSAFFKDGNDLDLHLQCQLQQPSLINYFVQKYPTRILISKFAEEMLEVFNFLLRNWF
jgi:hypothetical protein